MSDKPTIPVPGLPSLRSRRLANALRALASDVARIPEGDSRLDGIAVAYGELYLMVEAPEVRQALDTLFPIKKEE